MPTVPRYSEQQVRTIGTGAPQLSPISLSASPESFGAGVGRGLGDVAAVLQQEQDKADAVQVMGGDRALSEWELKAAHDPQTGALNLRGKNAFGLPDTVQADFDKTAAEIAKGLGNARQRAAFEKMANTRRQSLLKQVAHHVAGEMKNYAESENKAYIETAANSAVANFADPDRVDVEIDRARKAVLAHSTKIAGDPAAVTQERLAQAESGIRGAIVNRLLQDDPLAAQTYYDAHKDKMLEADKMRIERTLKPATEFEGGRRLATEAWAMRQAGNPAGEVEAFLTAGAKSRDQLGVAQSIMTQFEQAAKAEDQNKRGTLLEKFAGTPTRAAMNGILGSREYQAMQPEARGQLIEYMRHQVQAQEDHGRVLADRAEAKSRTRWESNPDALAKFMDTLDDPGFSAMTRQQIYALAPEVGPQLTAKLLAEHKDRNRADAAATAAASKFRIDNDLLNEAIPKELLQKGKKVELNAFRGIVETNLMEWKAQHPGKVPTLAEQQQIARSANTEYVAIGASWYGGDKTVKAYGVKPDMKIKPPDDFVAKMRSKGASDAEIAAAWKIKRGAN